MTETVLERTDYLMASIYGIGALHQWTRQEIEGALVRHLGWTELKARILVGHWMTTLPYRAPAAPQGRLEDRPNADETNSPTPTGEAGR